MCLKIVIKEIVSIFIRIKKSSDRPFSTTTIAGNPKPSCYLNTQYAEMRILVHIIKRNCNSNNTSGNGLTIRYKIETKLGFTSISENSQDDYDFIRA